MISAIRFWHEGYDVVTTSWTASAVPDRKSIDVAYTWGADGVALFPSVGTRRISFDIKLDDFVKMVGVHPVIDLRGREIRA